MLLARTRLVHFAMINYALPAERLRPHIPTERFEIPEFQIGGRPCAMLSVVNFLDRDFRFVRLTPFIKHHFPQTNHRAYVIDRRSGEPVVWFFGTTLGAWPVHAARLLWRLPWHRARYTFDCAYDETRKAYARYDVTIASDWCGGRIVIEDTGRPLELLEGFDSLAQMKLILTQPIEGFYWRRGGTLGRYTIWHDEIVPTLGLAKELSFSFYRDHGLLDQAELAAPHSIFITPQTEFEIHLPPRKVPLA